MKTKTIFFFAVLMAFFVLPSVVSGQLARRTFGTSNSETNSIIHEASGTDHYIINSISTGLGDILITRYTSTGGVLWRRTIGRSTQNEQAVSCINDANGNLVVLANDMTSNRFVIIKINPLTGTYLNYWDYTDLAIGQTIRGVKIALGTNNDYYLIANTLSGANFDEAYIIQINSAAGSVSDYGYFDFSPAGNNNPFGFYDFAQLSTNEWVIGGAWLDLAPDRYDAFAMVYNMSTNTIVNQRRYVLHSTHDGFDRLVVDHARQRIYFGAHTDNLTQIDVGVMCTNYSLTFQWFRLIPTSLSGESERLSSMIYDLGQDRILLGGFNTFSNQYGFLTCFDPNGNYQWSKYPAGVGVSNTTLNPFRMALQSGKILYTSNYNNAGNNDIFWGVERYDATPSGCFASKVYTPTSPVYSPVAISFTTTTSTLTQTSYTPGDLETTIPEQTVCNNCKVPEIGFVKLDNATISQSTFWGMQNTGIKYYITGTLTVNSGVTLDITNIDVVLDEGAEIVLLGSAVLRANNSVFRPCDPTRTWRGIRFHDNSSGVVNNCVFKNANFALNIITFSNNIKITNNQFSNCLVSIRHAAYANSSGSITENKFFVDNSPLPFPETNGAYGGTTNYSGVQVFEGANELIISQNEFIYAKSAGQSKRVYGIYLYNADATITENTFTNCYRSVDLSEPQTVRVENNEIEITRENINNEYQIIVSMAQSGSPLTIANNRINNFNPVTDPLILQAAIYAAHSGYFEVHDNLINGFKTGIQLYNVGYSKLYSNNIIGSSVYGIHAENCQNVSVRCNEIDMKYNKAGNSMSTGIRYYQTTGVNTNLDIRGNCIFNCYDAIVLTLNSSTLTQIPEIKNNYLYNYYDGGILNYGFTGSIGTGVTPASAGRNVFVSNNYNGYFGAIDIYSDTYINESGNYNDRLIGNLVTRIGNINLSHSTASCGHFFLANSNVRSELEDKCDYIATTSSTLLNYDWEFTSSLISPDGVKDVLETENNYNRLLIWATAAKTLAENEGESVKLKTIVSTQEKDEDVKMLFAAYCSIQEGRKKEAEAMLNQLQIMDDELLIVKDKMLLLTEAIGQTQPFSETTIQTMMPYINQYEYFSSELRRGFAPMGENDNTFAPLRPFSSPSQSERKMVVSEVLLTIYPNPVMDKDITIEYSTPNNSNSTLTVKDILGKQVGIVDVAFSAGSITLSTEKLQNGIYFISIECEQGVLKTEKLIVSK